MGIRVLFIGGTGVISSACTELAASRGMDLFHLNRGRTRVRSVPPEVKSIHADIRDSAAARSALTGHEFDVVVDWIAYSPEDVRRDIDLFRGRVGQYVFISTTSAYEKPVRSLPLTEETPLSNPFWEYSRLKIACEKVLMEAREKEQFPVTIVRPSHTYDKTKIPIRGGYTAIDRMRKGKPVFIHGDGTSLWTLTHHRDFARGFVGLLGNSRALGESFHITSDELLSWNQIHALLAEAAGCRCEAVYVPSTLIREFDKEIGDGLLGDKAHSLIFDNSKIKRFVPGFEATIPFSEGAREIMEWYDANPDRRVTDDSFNQLTERLIKAMPAASAHPGTVFPLQGLRQGSK